MSAPISNDPSSASSITNAQYAQDLSVTTTTTQAELRLQQQRFDQEMEIARETMLGLNDDPDNNVNPASDDPSAQSERRSLRNIGNRI